MSQLPKPPADIPTSGLSSHPPRPAYTRISCSKCGSKSLALVEQWETGIDFRVTDGWLDRANGNLDGNGGCGGHPVKVRAICDCGHEWTVRNATQIDDVVEEIE